jgi:hypothetical protein
MPIEKDSLEDRAIQMYHQGWPFNPVFFCVRFYTPLSVRASIYAVIDSLYNLLSTSIVLLVP